MSDDLKIKRKKKQEDNGPQPGIGGKARLRRIDEIVDEAVTGKKKPKKGY
jgi:hypothetical protein